MRLVGTRPKRLATVPYRAAGTGGVPRNVQLGVEQLPVDKLPAGCDALLVAGDLQGVASSPLGGDPGLLGIALADYLGVWAESGLLPPAGRVGRASVRGTLERRAPALTLCGHVHWAEPVAVLGDGHIVNVDARVVVLTA